MKSADDIRKTVLLGICACILWAGSLRAEDIETFLGSTPYVAPNVLIILDTSGSMAEKAISGNQVYDYNTTYSGSYVKDRVYTLDGSTWKELKKDNYCKSWFLGACISRQSGTTVSVTDIACPVARENFNLFGNWKGRLDMEDSNGNEIFTFNCTTTEEESYNTEFQLATGNYLNFLNTAGITYDAKIRIARAAITNMLNSVGENDVRFGLMRFNGLGLLSLLDPSYINCGGRLLAKCGTSHAGIISAMNADTDVWCATCGSDSMIWNNPQLGLPIPLDSGGTPLAESLAEAILYFGGKHTWANGGWSEKGYPDTGNGFGNNGTYESPVHLRCQRNYVIIITDGDPQGDDGYSWDLSFSDVFWDPILYGKSILNYLPAGSPHRDPDGDGAESRSLFCNHWLDDVAKVAYEEDLFPNDTKDDSNGSYEDPNFDPQHIVTYAIGFGSSCDTSYLYRVTDLNHGRGATYFAQNATLLSTKLTQLVSGLVQTGAPKNGIYASETVPVNKGNRSYSGNSIYVSMFRDASGPCWKGNLKKFGYSRTGQILDRNGHVTSFSATPRPSSCWGYPSSDGNDVITGGAGAQLLGQGTRNFYTYDRTRADPVADLGEAANAFSKANGNINSTVLNLGGTTQTVTDLIDFIRGEGIYASGATKRTWLLGDIIHSQPATMRAGDMNYIFVGANDGFLHCFEDNEGITYRDLSDDQITEKWCFVPWDLLSRLNLLKNGATHQYFVDGSPMLYSTGDYKYCTFGLRRGGNTYYTLKVGQKNGTDWAYMNPTWAWGIRSNILGGSPTLGQSWATPHFCKLKSGANSSIDAIIFAGGYDASNQDLTTPVATGDSCGNAVYAVDASSGSLLSSLLKFTYIQNDTNWGNMKWSIIDFAAFDSNDDTYTDTIYAGDMRGQVFAMKGATDGSAWTGRKLFQAGVINAQTSQMTAETAQLKFFCAPDAVVQGYEGDSGYVVNDFVYIGSGDREHPTDRNFDNRFYAIRNRNDTNVLTENSLANVTTYGRYSTTPPATLRGNSSNGWFIKLGYEGTGETHVRPGEKVVSTPLVFEGIVYFTTFAPSSAGDMCSPTLDGDGFLYAVDYLTGEAIRAFGFNMTAAQRNGTAPLNETNRRISLGKGMPPQPKLTVTAKGPVLVIKDFTLAVPFRKGLNEYFWQQ
jgi:type IV pilus assembly protein PilY1